MKQNTNQLISKKCNFFISWYNVCKVAYASFSKFWVFQFSAWNYVFKHLKLHFIITQMVYNGIVPYF